MLHHEPLIFFSLLLLQLHHQNVSHCFHLIAIAAGHYGLFMRIISVGLCCATAAEFCAHNFRIKTFFCSAKANALAAKWAKQQKPIKDKVSFHSVAACNKIGLTNEQSENCASNKARF